MKYQEKESWDVKQKQEQELQAFLSKQRNEASSFQTYQVNAWNNLKEKQTQETWRLFGKTSQARRPSITSMWDQNSTTSSSRSSPWSPRSSSSASSLTWSPIKGGDKNKTETSTYWKNNS